MHTRRSLALLCALGAGFAGGFFVGRTSPTPRGAPVSAAARAKNVAATPKTDPRPHTATPVIPASQPVPADGRGGVLPALKTRTGTWSVLWDLHKLAVIQGVPLPLVGPDGGLPDRTAEIFGLTEQERATITEAFHRARENVAKAELDHATVRRGSAGELVISITPFPEEGGVIYDSVIQSIANTLGPQRHAAFLALSGSQLERGFNHFGALQRTVMLTVQIENSRPMYVLEDVAATSGANSKSKSRFTTRDEMVRYLRGLGSLVPPEF